MREPMLKDQDTDDGVYEFVCVRCGVTETLTLTSDGQVPYCGCGSPLSPLTLVAESSIDRDACGEDFLLNESCEEVADEAPDYGSLDHPHVEPDCQFCMIRQQRPSQHRLWCAVFFLRVCNCGYEQA